VMSIVSLMGILTYRSLMSKVRTLWFLLTVSFVRLWARAAELSVVY
jgi:hypothetical protein